jgi:hypothetical protein
MCAKWKVVKGPWSQKVFFFRDFRGKWCKVVKGPWTLFTRVKIFSIKRISCVNVLGARKGVHNSFYKSLKGFPGFLY